MSRKGSTAPFMNSVSQEEQQVKDLMEEMTHEELATVLFKLKQQ